MSIKQLNLEQKYESLRVDYSQDLTPYSTLQLKGVGDVITVYDEKTLCGVVSDLFNGGISYRILGKGSNVLIDEFSNEPYIRINFPFDKNQLNEKRKVFDIPASVSLNVLTACAIKYGFSGWEVFTGIPASLGGAIVMNAGTSLGEISNIVEDVTIVNAQGEIEVRSLSKNDFSYRENHFLKDGEVIVSARLTYHELSDEVSGVIRRYLQKRTSSQPLTKKTCGCIFKNKLQVKGSAAKTCRAGEFIDMIGLKGFRYKNLRVSPVHANFIENMGGATKEDFLELIKIINNEVDKNAGFKFDTEVVSYS